MPLGSCRTARGSLSCSVQHWFDTHPPTQQRCTCVPRSYVVCIGIAHVHLPSRCFRARRVFAFTRWCRGVTVRLALGSCPVHLYVSSCCALRRSWEPMPSLPGPPSVAPGPPSPPPLRLFTMRGSTPAHSSDHAQQATNSQSQDCCGGPKSSPNPILYFGKPWAFVKHME